MPFNNAYEHHLAKQLEAINRAHIQHGRLTGRGYSGGAGLDLGSLIALPMKLMSGLLGGLGGAMPEQDIMLGRNKATYSPEVFGSGFSGGRRRRHAAPRRHNKGGAYSGGADMDGGAFSGGASSGGAYSGGAYSGGRGPSAKSKAAAQQNPWLMFVKNYRKRFPNKPYKQVLKEASVQYRRHQQEAAEDLQEF
jgi:hypothetical protein